MLERVGGCRIIEEIGAGGMAVVYRAEQETLRRGVAVKALKGTAAAEPELAARFEREALAMGVLHHENVVQVYDFQRGPEAAYMIMELVDGIDLFELLSRAPALPVDVAAIVGLQLGRALEHAHAHGIVHRDVKPANVLLARGGVVKLTDFGIARGEGLVDLTREGTGVGTPSYMSPEQVLGEKLDFRSDLFSLGIVLYQMLCGVKPFVEEGELSVMHRIRLARPTAPRRVRPAIPRELERIVLRCLEKRREDRHRSTADLVLALQRFVERRGRAHPRTRLASFLREHGLPSAGPAEREVAASRDGGRVARRPRIRRARLLRLIGMQAVLLAAIAGIVGAVHAVVSARAGAPGERAEAGERAARSGGQVRVVATPPAEIFVDGRRVGTTPLARPLQLPEGRHHVELRRPRQRTEARDVEVSGGRVATVRGALRP